MVICTYLFGLLVSWIILLKLVKVLSEQYYSMKRFFKVLKYEFLKNKFYFSRIIVFALAAFFFYFFKYYFIANFILILTTYLLFNDISLKNYLITRRKVLLILYSTILYFFLFLLLFFMNSFVACILIVFELVISLVISYVLLLPVEYLIREYYISKARKKLYSKKRIIIGITGSFGKTTMKNIVYSILNSHYKISPQNHNFNTINGICKYINEEMDINDEVAIFEIGVDAPKSIKKFKKIFSLDYAFITSIGEMHLATFKSIENIAKEKIAISDLLNKDGILFIDKKIEEKYKMYLEGKKYISYGNEYKILNGVISYFGKEIDTGLISEFQYSKLCGALKLASILQINNYEIEYGLKNIQIPNRRLHVKYFKENIIIDDSYNANIEGVKESLKILARYGKEKVVFTGGLIEYGKKFVEYNNLFATLLEDIDYIFLLNLEKNHPLNKKLNELGLKEKIESIDVSEIYKIIEERFKNKAILILAKGSNQYLK